MHKPLVSIVLCTYNDADYVAQTIHSVLNQSFSDFEFIIWNDGSTDDTESIVQSFQDSRIRYYHHANTGVGRARFLALEKACGKYVAVIDGDDLCLPERIGTEVNFLEKHKDYVLVASQVIYIDENGAETGRSFSCTSDYIIRKRIWSESIISNPSVMYRKDIYDKTGGYASINLGEDHLLFCRMNRYGKLKILPQPLVKYRVRQNSLIHKYNGDRYLPLLTAYRQKMSQDGQIASEDIRLYNELYGLMKTNVSATEASSTTSQTGRHSLQETLFRLARPLVGAAMASRLVIGLKNLIYFIKCYC